MAGSTLIRIHLLRSAAILLFVMTRLGLLLGQQDIRLVSGPHGSHLGRLEVNYNDTWGTVCDNNFYYGAALVACRSLGFETAVCGAPRAKFGQGAATAPVWMSSVVCNPGSHQKLEDCSFVGWGDTGCGHERDVGLICQNDDLIGPPQEVTVVETTSTTITLQWQAPELYLDETQLGGVSVEYRINYAVNQDSEEEGGNQPEMLADIIEANPPNRLLMTGVIAGLSNSTRYLLRIRAEILYPYCSSDLVGVYTSYISVLTSAQPKISTLPVRLMSPRPQEPFMGRIEVSYDSQWGTVCEDGFSYHDARVVCNMLGYQKGALCVVGNAKFGEGTGPVWLDRVTCSKKDEVLEDCSFSDWGNTSCQHSDDVGVICKPDNFLGPVQNLVAEEIGSSSVLLRWDNYDFPPDAHSRRYYLQYRADSDLYTRIKRLADNTDHYRLTELTFGANYTISIRAELRYTYCRYSSLFGKFSAPLRVTTKKTAPTKPPTQFHVVALNSTSIEAQWGPPPADSINGEILGYRIFVQGPLSESEVEHTIVDSRARQFVVGGLKPGSSYKCSMLAYTIGDGPRTVVLSVTTKDSDYIPYIVKFGIMGTGIDKVTRESGDPGIKVLCGPGVINDVTVGWYYGNGTEIAPQGKDLQLATYPNHTLELRIGLGRGLRLCDAGTYVCEAKQVSQNGQSQKREFTLVVGDHPPPPERPLAIKIRSKSATLAWEEPACTGGHTVTEFNLRYSVDSSMDFMVINGIDGARRSYTIDSLEPDTPYMVSVQAVSFYHQLSNFTPGYYFTTLPPAPFPPRDVEVEIVNYMQVRVSWRKPAVTNGNIRQYRVYGMPISTEYNESSLVQQEVAAPDTSAIVSLPHHSVWFSFQVSASVFLNGVVENEGDLSEVTDSTIIELPEPILPAPENLTVANVTNSSVSLQWDLQHNNIIPVQYYNVHYSAVVSWTSPMGVPVEIEETGDIVSMATTITLSPLTPSTEYRFSVSAVTSDGGEGGRREASAVTLKPEGERLAFFNIKIGPISNCLEWMDEDSTQKLVQIRNSLLSSLNLLCDCDLSHSHIRQEEFSCRSNIEKQIVYRARMVGADHYSASGLVDLLQLWVSQPHSSITLGQNRLEVDKSCPVGLDSLESNDCKTVDDGTSTGTAPPPPTTDRTVVGGGTTTTNGSGTNRLMVVGIAVGGLISLLLFVAVLLLTLLAVRGGGKLFSSLFHGNKKFDTESAVESSLDNSSSFSERENNSIYSKDPLSSPSKSSSVMSSPSKGSVIEKSLVAP